MLVPVTIRNLTKALDAGTGTTEFGGFIFMGIKKCKLCKKSKSINDFYRNGLGGYRGICKKCQQKRVNKVFKPKKCKLCLSIFTPKNNWQVYCSPKCIVLDNRKKKEEFKRIKCDICNNAFIQKSYLNKFCSKGCSIESQKQKAANKPNLKNCKTCGHEFKPYTTFNKFCSSECRLIEEKNRIRKTGKRLTEKQRANILGSKNPAYRNGDYTRQSNKTTKGQCLFNRNKNEIIQEMINDIGHVYCQYCKTSNSLRFESHHIIWRSEKPLHENLHKKANILHVCIKCHNTLHKHKGLRNEIVKNRRLNLLFGNDVLNKDVPEEIKQAILLNNLPF